MVVPLHLTCEEGGIADLEISKVGPTGAIQPGSQVTYTVRITNTGPSDVPAFDVTDTLPPLQSFVSCFASSGTCGLAASGPPNDVVSWQSDPERDFLVGESQTLWVVAQVDATACGRMRNTAWITTDVEDPNPEDNSAFADTLVKPCPEPGILVTKRLTDPPGPVLVGDILTYEIEMQNIGNWTFGTVYLDDTYDSQKLQLASVSKKHWWHSVGATEGHVSWYDLTDPPPSGYGTGVFEPGVTFVLTVRFKAIGTGLAQNCAMVDGDPIGVEETDKHCVGVRIGLEEL